ncbi:hypothetical protein KSP40_PGU002773 [Platanthera guangdongensis]|uniref:Uncharacterized protein n=1 Tax=Platanthera guangdongensis TaxID=2320717 RepID=A0ABR2M3M6_9ASPA
MRAHPCGSMEAVPELFRLSRPTHSTATKARTNSITSGRLSSRLTMGRWGTSTYTKIRWADSLTSINRVPGKQILRAIPPSLRTRFGSTDTDAVRSILSRSQLRAFSV